MSSSSTSTDQLASWFKAQITALYTTSSSSEESDFKTSFDSSFASDAQILANLEAIKLDLFMKELQGRAFAAQSVDMEWNELIEVPAEQDSNGRESGIVAGMFTVTRSLKFRIRVGPAQSRTKVVFTAKVASGDGSPKIVYLNLVHVDQAVPIHFPEVKQ